MEQLFKGYVGPSGRVLILASENKNHRWLPFPKGEQVVLS